MRRRYRETLDDASLDMTPMLDIVFILLIFFIVTTSFVKETGIEINPPIAATAERQERASILVAIDADNAIWIDKRPIALMAVRANIERLKAQYPEGHVVIQADEASSTGMFVKVMDQIRTAGIENIAIAAQRET